MGCLTCRRRKVKCDEGKPNCGKCTRLDRTCIWSDELIVAPQAGRAHFGVLAPANAKGGTIHLSGPRGQNFVVEFPNVDRATMPYIHHFITFCCRFMVYPNDDEGNPFQDQLVPLAIGSPALLHAMCAVAAGHLARSQGQHDLVAARHYSIALRELNATLSDPSVAKSDATLGACLLLCVYEVLRSFLALAHISCDSDCVTIDITFRELFVVAASSRGEGIDSISRRTQDY